MPGIGAGELILILLIVLIIFGAGKLPQIGDALGRSIKNFKRASQGTDEIDVTPQREIEAKAGPKGSASAATGSAADREEARKKV
jgi:sec-independent protein translocase protein TatA